MQKSHFSLYLSRFKFTLLILILLTLGNLANGQEQDNTNPNFYFKGNISANSNGISLIPSFSLGRPALIFELALGGND